jgi:hypothetical protein
MLPYNSTDEIFKNTTMFINSGNVNWNISSQIKSINFCLPTRHLIASPLLSTVKDTNFPYNIFLQEDGNPFYWIKTSTHEISKDLSLASIITKEQCCHMYGTGVIRSEP